MHYHNWGKYPTLAATEIAPNNEPEAKKMLPHDAWIARGMGRCYGDSALAGHLFSSLKMNRFLAFDEKTGIVQCESGVTFEDLIEIFLPKGWFPPVTPGTKFVSMGGAIASDVHGKNHHSEGGFSHYLLDFELLLADGQVKYCSKTENADLFWATCGGMGLTGFVLRLRLQLKKVESSYIKARNIKAKNLDKILGLLNDLENSTYTVAWIDTLSAGSNLGRSILMQGEHATLSDLQGSKQAQQPLAILHKQKFTIPFNFPNFVLNNFTGKAFNFLYYHKQLTSEKNFIQGYDAFFYPLDVIHHWNRVYGKRGFTQYQLVVPKEKGYEALKKVIEKVANTKQSAFLSVLKTLAAQEGILSFPTEGYTLTMDFPITPTLFPFLSELDDIVISYGGRVYLTKDVRLDAENFRKMYPKFADFQQIINQVNPQRMVYSEQAKRLKI